MLKTLVTSVALSAVLAPNALAARAKTVETVIESVHVTPTNGGINPDAFAYDIKASVLVAGNACEAKGVKVALTQQTKKGVIVVAATRQSAAAGRICPRIWAPVYRSVSLTVRGYASRVKDVVVKNIGELGTLTSVSTLLDAQAGAVEVSVTGYIDHVMAIGGETTGLVLVLASGEQVEIDLATNNLDHDLENLEGREVTLKGLYKTVQGVEIPSRQVLEVTSVD